MFATLPPPPQRLLVFARLPELGKVKTRLAESIGAEKTLAVYAAMLHDLLRAIGESTGDLEIEIAWAPTQSANGETLQRAFGAHTLVMQAGSNLGDRLSMAFSERFFFHRAQKVIAIGVDDPRLSREIVDHAFGLLESCEWVVGPAKDGGYYLIGCRAAAFNPEVFFDIDWGSDSVLQSTLQHIRDWNHAAAVLPTRDDIDVIEDLQRFARETREAEGELPQLLRSWGMAA
ncbi:MAG TPA: TIGR04282 family arsenosugar biosynthesis glycosyltransferase [Thermoanaerobaculia bacterium]|nr:TIGR04282 family arsenosugar biosynthesis glycosyltransferase [Thermoanaerobaculia bacterium]